MAATRALSTPSPDSSSTTSPTASSTPTPCSRATTCSASSSRSSRLSLPTRCRLSSRRSRRRCSSSPRLLLVLSPAWLALRGRISLRAASRCGMAFRVSSLVRRRPVRRCKVRDAGKSGEGSGVVDGAMQSMGGSLAWDGSLLGGMNALLFQLRFDTRTSIFCEGYGFEDFFLFADADADARKRSECYMRTCFRVVRNESFEVICETVPANLRRGENARVDWLTCFPVLSSTHASLTVPSCGRWLARFILAHVVGS